MVIRPNRLRTDAWREIRHTFSRFLSLVILSALAVAFLVGLRAAAPIWNTPPTNIMTGPI